MNDRLDATLTNWNPKSIPEAYAILGKEARAALAAAKRGYNTKEYRWGATIPTYGFAKDPLDTNCMVQFERYRGLYCQAGREDQVSLWPTYTDIFRRASTECIENFDFDQSPASRIVYDMSVACSNNSISIYRHAAGSNCSGPSKNQEVYADWRATSEFCVNDPGRDLSFKLKRNNSRNIAYYKQAFAVQEWLKVNSYDSNAGSCVVRGWEAFVDSDCAVKAEAVDEELGLAVDTANMVAMYAGNRCGPVGHLFPFETPFAKVRCNSLLINVTQYKDWECRE